MGTKRAKPTPPQQLEDLLKAHALRRLESVSPSPPKPAKAKLTGNQKQKKKR
jgi:hypothetical protein